MSLNRSQLLEEKVVVELGEECMKDTFFGKCSLAVNKFKNKMMALEKKGAETIEVVVVLAVMAGLLFIILPKVGNSLKTQAGNTTDKLDALEAIME